MLAIIARESRSLAEYVRRAEAWASAEANRPTDREIANQWMILHMELVHGSWEKNQNRIRRLIREARKHRISKRINLWGRLVQNL